MNSRIPERLSAGAHPPRAKVGPAPQLEAARPAAFYLMQAPLNGWLVLLADGWMLSGLAPTYDPAPARADFPPWLAKLAQGYKLVDERAPDLKQECGVMLRRP